MAHFDLKSADASCARADKEKLRKATHTAAIVNTLKSILFIMELQLTSCHGIDSEDTSKHVVILNFFGGQVL
jgi:hypothetical protein